MSKPHVLAVAKLHPFYMEALQKTFTVHDRAQDGDAAAFALLAPQIRGLAATGESRVSAELLAHDISRNNETLKVEVGAQISVGKSGRLTAPIKVTRADGAIFVVVVAGPLEIDYPIHPIAQALGEATHEIQIISVNELTIRGNLPDATSSVLEVVTS